MRLADLAERLGCELLDGGDTVIAGVASLEDAGPGQLAFVRSSRYAAQLEASAAGAVILPADLDAPGRPAIRADDPSRAFADAVELLVEVPRPEVGVHASATVDAAAHVDGSVAIGPGCSVGRGARIGAGSVLHARAVVYPGVEIGSDCELHAGVVLREGTRLGDRVRLQPGVLVGGDGFGFLPTPDGVPRRVPQIGRVVIEDDVDVGAGTTIDRATLGETRIRRGAKIDNLVMIAHNCDIGEGAIIVAQSGLAGGTRVGARAILMARTGSAGHLAVGEGAFVGARSGLHHDVEPGGRVFGSPAQGERAWHRQLAALRHLPAVLRRVRSIERILGLRPDSPSPPSTSTRSPDAQEARAVAPAGTPRSAGQEDHEG